MQHTQSRSCISNIFFPLLAHLIRPNQKDKKWPYPPTPPPSPPPPTNYPLVPSFTMRTPPTPTNTHSRPPHPPPTNSHSPNSTTNSLQSTTSATTTTTSSSAHDAISPDAETESAQGKQLRERCARILGSYEQLSWWSRFYMEVFVSLHFSSLLLPPSHFPTNPKKWKRVKERLMYLFNRAYRKRAFGFKSKWWASGTRMKVWCGRMSGRRGVKIGNGMNGGTLRREGGRERLLLVAVVGVGRRAGRDE